MPRCKATLAYDGTPYHGWQIQPNRPTIQGTLAQSLRHITGETTLPQGSGRTDTGVHALAQVAHFDLTCNIPPENLHRALNRSLPPSIRILTLTHCPQDFHARHSVLRKTYEYRILPRPHNHETICPPFLAPYVWPCPNLLDLDLLNQAAAQILGSHDFTSFAAINPDQSTRAAALPNPKPIPLLPHPSLPCAAWDSSLPNPEINTRTIQASQWTFDEQADPPILRYRVTGSGFLHHMVRNLVGTFVECGANRRDPNQIPHILARKNRQAAGPTALPQGLFLVEVFY